MATPSLPPHLTALLAVARKIQTLFAARSSLQVVAARDLQKTLRCNYPQLVITDSTPVLMSPQYEYVDQAVRKTRFSRSAMTDELINRFVDDKLVDYSEGQVITDQPDAQPVVPGALKNFDAQTAVNDCGARLLQLCQQALLEDWSELSETAQTRFELLAALLKDALRDVARQTPTLDAKQQQMIADVLQTPDNNLRTGTTRAYLIDHWGEQGGKQFELLRGMVLVSSQGATTDVVLFTLAAGIEVFASLAALGAALFNRMTGLAPESLMQWRLFEPDTNIFDGFALTFLVKQLADLEYAVAHGRGSPYWSAALLDRAHELATGDFDSLDLKPHSDLQRLYAAMPLWLKQANRDVRGLFSEYFEALGTLFKQADWKFFSDGLPSILDYTRQKLMDKYPQPETLKPDDVVVTIHTVRGGSAAGGFPVRIITTLLNVALENLGGLPGNSITLKRRDGSAVPSWMTPETIKQWISEVDIGQNYPALIASSLKDDEIEVSWRRRRFLQQLRIELPMLALELFARGQAGFTRTAYRMVVAVMSKRAEDRYVAQKAIVLRPLTFKAGALSEPDTVTNMFVIGPRDFEQGPQILYCPMSATKLQAFASHQALFEAIKRPGQLQQQVLAWMSETGRATYQAGGFQDPHFNSIDGLTMLIDAMTSKPAQLGREEVEGDYGDHLYKSQVQALMEQADRQSVSNSENRWARRKEGLYLGLNSVMPFVTGPLAAVGWLLVAWDVQQQINVVRGNKAEGKEVAMAGFLMNMALVMAHYSRTNIESALDEASSSETQEASQGARIIDADVVPGEAVVPVVASDNPQVLTPQTSVARALCMPTARVDYGWITPSSRLTASQEASLNAFTVSEPQRAESITSGLNTGLHEALGQLYVHVEDDWFKVSRFSEGVRIASAESDGRPGPWLKSNGRGGWMLDLRLRLLGGSSSEQASTTAQAGVELKTRFDALYAEFDGQAWVEVNTQEALAKVQNPATGIRQLSSELARVETLGGRAKQLSELLEQRRRFEVVSGFSTMRSAFLGRQIRCLRAQIVLKSALRQLRYTELGGPQQDISVLSLSDFARTSITSQNRLALFQLGKLHEQVIGLHRQAYLLLGQMRRTAVTGDAQLSELDVAPWADQRAMVAWQEAGLRPKMLYCLKQSTVGQPLEQLARITLLCQVKLSTYRRLQGAERPELETRIRVMNDVIDALAWADVRLGRLSGTSGDFFDQAAFNDFRKYLQQLRANVLKDVLKQYAQRAGETRKKQFAGQTLRVQSREWGALIGEKSLNPDIGDALTFTDPYSRRVYATFEKTTTSGQVDWTLRRVPGAPVSSALHYLRAAELKQLGERCRERLPTLEADLRLAPRTIRRELEALAQSMLQLREHFAGEAPIDKQWHQQMTDQARDLKTLAREAYARMVLAREPTAAGVEDLLAEGVISIKEVPGTGIVSGEGRAPLFRCFYISKVAPSSDAVTTPQIIWFAHFRYPVGTVSRSGVDFSRAYLRRYADPYLSFEQRLGEARDLERRLSLMRSTLDPKSAQQLFFTEGPVS
ncbi:hypothetical protein D3C85_574280 [compost metagenome]